MKKRRSLFLKEFLQSKNKKACSVHIIIITDMRNGNSKYPESYRNL